MATPRLGLVVEDKPTELSCTCLLHLHVIFCSLCYAVGSMATSVETRQKRCWETNRTDTSSSERVKTTRETTLFVLGDLTNYYNNIIVTTVDPSEIRTPL